MKPLKLALFCLYISNQHSLLFLPLFVYYFVVFADAAFLLVASRNIFIFFKKIISENFDILLCSPILKHSIHSPDEVSKGGEMRIFLI